VIACRRKRRRYLPRAGKYRARAGSWRVSVSGVLFLSSVICRCPLNRLNSFPTSIFQAISLSTSMFLSRLQISYIILFIFWWLVQSMSLSLHHFFLQRIIYAHLIPRSLIVYFVPTQLVIDGIWETQLIQHVKKYQLTTDPSWCPVRQLALQRAQWNHHHIARMAWTRGDILGPHCRPKIHKKTTNCYKRCPMKTTHMAMACAISIALHWLVCWIFSQFFVQSIEENMR